MCHFSLYFLQLLYQIGDYFAGFIEITRLSLADMTIASKLPKEKIARPLNLPFLPRPVGINSSRNPFSI